MINISKVLLPHDFSDYSEDAALFAVEIAKHYDAELHALHIMQMHEDVPGDFQGDETHLDEYHDSREDHLKALLEEKAGLHKGVHKVIPVLERGFSVGGRIIEYAEEHEVELIIMGTHGRSALPHLLLGSEAEVVVRGAHCPVLTVHKGTADFIRSHRHERILVPVDFSDFSEYAFKYGIGIAQALNAKVDVLHVIEDRIHPALYAGGNVSIFDVIPDLRERTEQTMIEFIQRHGDLPVEVRPVLLDGNTFSVVLDYAKKEEVELVVMATHGHSGFEHLLLGSTTEKVIRKAHCPVLSVKHPEREFIT
jgi:nucleotide-binding universal stress UspA family protein